MRGAWNSFGDFCFGYDGSLFGFMDLSVRHDQKSWQYMGVFIPRSMGLWEVIVPILSIFVESAKSNGKNWIYSFPEVLGST